jgi:hypothetical protein
MAQRLPHQGAAAIRVNDQLRSGVLLTSIGLDHWRSRRGRTGLISAEGRIDEHLDLEPARAAFKVRGG